MSTSIGALCISGYQAYMQRLQTYASVFPSLTAYTMCNYNSTQNPGNFFSFVMENKGVGLAKIDSFRFSHNQKPFETMSKIITATTQSYDFGSNELWQNRVISANEQVTLVSLNDSIARITSERFLQSPKPEVLQAEVFYSSIYGEKFKLTWRNTPYLVLNEKIE